MKIVYIDAQNVYMAIKQSGWLIDWKKFYLYLIEKHKVDVIYYTVWYVSTFNPLYKSLIDIWYVMLFKKTIILPDGTIKWNVDIDIAIRAVLEMKDSVIEKGYIVTNDGDYNTLVSTMKSYGVFWELLLPNIKTASRLLKKECVRMIDLQDIKHKIQKLPSN